MNARNQVFELSVEGRQVEEVALMDVMRFLVGFRAFDATECLRILKNDRVPGRSQVCFIRYYFIEHKERLDFLLLTFSFHYKQEGSYSVGTIGYEDVDCDFIDLTYVRCASADLDNALKKEVSQFSDLLLSTDNAHNGQISLEFYQKKLSRWPFPPESISWEIWTLKVNLISLNNEHERQKYREKIGEILAEKILFVAEAMNRHEYVPKIPNHSEMDLIFDNTYTDVQPYLFKINYQSSEPSNSIVTTTVRKLFKETMSV